MKPLLKWPGGKSRAVASIVNYVEEITGSSTEFLNLIEPFCGGAALTFSGLFAKKGIINDINSELINFYQSVSYYSNKLVSEIDLISREYENSLDQHGYYKDRVAEFNSIISTKEDDGYHVNIRLAALMMYINRSCFNALYRVNSKGLFNVPWNKKTKQTFFNVEEIKKARELLLEKRILNEDAISVIDHATEREVIYCDPPYAPLSPSANFVNYDKKGFSAQNHIELLEACQRAANRGCYVFISNSKCTFTENLYEGYDRKEIYMNRAINSKGEKRQAVPELLVHVSPK